MKKIILAFLILSSVSASAQKERSISFDNSWRFTKDSVSNAEQVIFDDTNGVRWTCHMTGALKTCPIRILKAIYRAPLQKKL